MLKSVLVFFSIVSITTAMAQKPTGGCGYKLSIDSIDALLSPTFLLYNGVPHFFNVNVKCTEGVPDGGKLTVKIDGAVAGIAFRPLGAPDHVVVTTGVFHYLPGYHQLNIYWESDCSDELLGGILVRDPASPNDTNDVHGYSSPAAQSFSAATASREIGAYPLPASGNYIRLGGVGKDEQILFLQVKDEYGLVRMAISDLDEQDLKVWVGNLKNGIYFARMMTNERTVSFRFEVLR